MIVRIKFKASVKNHSMYDELDIHAKTVKDAKGVFEYWLSRGLSLRGNSGIFHLQEGYGKIKFRSAKERKE